MCNWEQLLFSEKSEEGDLKVQKGHVGLPLLLAKPSQQCCHTSRYSLLPRAGEQEEPRNAMTHVVTVGRDDKTHTNNGEHQTVLCLREILRFRQCINCGW